MQSSGIEARGETKTPRIGIFNCSSYVGKNIANVFLHPKFKLLTETDRYRCDWRKLNVYKIHCIRDKKAEYPGNTKHTFSSGWLFNLKRNPSLR